MGCKRVFFYFIFFVFHTSIFAQQYSNGQPFIYQPSKESSIGRIAPSTIESILNLSGENRLNKSADKSDPWGYRVESYIQDYKGIPIEHARYNLVKKNGRVISLAGEYYNLNEFDVKPSISNDVALQHALDEVQASSYAWEEGGKIPEGKLVICKNPENGQPTLAYKFDIYALNPLSREWIYVDARSGKVILRDAILKHELGMADTRYSNRQNIQTTNSGSGYILKDETRGNGIQTYNLNQGTSYYSATDFTDLDNNWSEAEYGNADKDNAALDAHFAASKTYDYFLQNHSRNSFDNNGAKINVYTHYGTNYVNAFWNGEVLTFGDGGYSSSAGRTLDPLTTVDIVAHEYAHAICQYTANLVYQNESGALNEALSDIWGSTVKCYTDSTKNTWLMGDETQYYFRSMSNPKERSQPDTYLGEYWYAGSSDRGGVHTNSGVLNYWFFLLVQGGSGLNDNGDSYSISPVGFEKATNIVYRTETIYLTANSEYKDARRFSIQAAEDLYGQSSNEVQQCIAAWDAVGVYDFESAPSNLVASATEDSSGVYVGLSWTDNSDWESGFEIYRNPTSSDSLILIKAIGENLTSFRDTLDAEGGAYAYHVKAISDMRKSAYSNEAKILAGQGVVVMSEEDLETCKGVLLDPGGLDNYSNNQNIIMVIYPKDSGKYVSIDFEEFNLESWRDYLRVYDGNNVSAPQLGNYTGNYLPDFVASSASDGSLTLRFISDEITTAPGFQANITCLDTIPQPDLITYAQDTVLQNTTAGHSVTLNHVLENIGNKRATTSTIAAYLSLDKEIDSTDVFLNSWNSYTLNPGQSTIQYQYLNIPYTTKSGGYYVLWKVDYTNIINESNEQNNIGSASIMVEEPELDLSLSNLSAPSDIAAGNNVFVSVSMENTGNSTFPPGDLGYYLSVDNLYDSSDTFLGTERFSSISTYGSDNVNSSVKIPENTLVNDYYLIVLLDPRNEIKEIDETNNYISKSIKIDAFGTYFTMPFKGNNVINTCSGTLYDNGYNSDYQTYSDDTLTIYPESGKYIQLAFNDFYLRSSYDQLEIYNGPSTSSPSFGSYSGQRAMPVIYSTDPTGAITLRFHSSYYSYPGFEATISCIDEIPESDLSISNFHMDEPILIKESNSTYYFTVGNEVGVPVRSIPYEITISKDSLRSDAVTILQDTIDMVWLNDESISGNFVLPDSMQQGTYFLWVEINKEKTIDEIDFDNNLDYQGVVVVDPVVDLRIEEASTSIYNPYPGASLSIQSVIKNKGAINSESFYTGFYISKDSAFNENAVYLGNYYLSYLYPGNTRSISKSVTLPDSLEKGNYYLHIYVDHENNVEELLEGNNFYSIPIELTDPFMDLEMLTLTLDKDSILLTEPFYIRGSYINNGNQNIYDNYYLSFYISKDNHLDSTDVLYYEQYIYSSLYSGNTSSFSYYQPSENIDVDPGSYYLIAHVDDRDEVDESIETNNTMYEQVYIKQTLIDVRLTKDTQIWPDTINYQEQFNLRGSVINDGNSDLRYVYVRLYLSTDALYDENDLYLDYDYSSLLTSGETESFNIYDYLGSNQATEGKYYLIAKTEFEYDTQDASPENNVIIQPVYVKAPRVDILVNSITPNDITIYRGENLTINLKITNDGPDNALASSNAYAYITQDTTSENYLISLGTRYVSSIDSKEEIDIIYNYNNTSALDTGLYFIVGQADYYNDLAETDENNNAYIASFRIAEYNDEDVFSIPATGSQSVTTCDRIITDDGGIFGDYSNGSNGTLTIYPGVSGAMVNLTFTSFYLESCCDYLEIYDGESTSAELIGTYRSSSPNGVAATNASGALTLRFHSDGSVAYEGFVARATCQGDLLNLPDLKAYNLSLDNVDDIRIGGNINTQLSIDNLGGMYSTDNVAYFYLSLDQDISPGDIYLGSQSFNDLEPNSGIEINPSLKIPANMTEGDYYLLIQVRGQQNDGIPLENNLSNNTVSVKINLTRSANVLSLDDENNSHILIYPNPLLYGKLLTVELDYKAVMLIFSIEGRMVKKEALSVGKNHIDLDALPKGSYLLKCISKDRTDEAKIIIR